MVSPIFQTRKARFRWLVKRSGHAVREVGAESNHCSSLPFTGWPFIPFHFRVCLHFNGAPSNGQLCFSVPGPCGSCCFLISIQRLGLCGGGEWSWSPLPPPPPTDTAGLELLAGQSHSHLEAAERPGSRL